MTKTKESDLSDEVDLGDVFTESFSATLHRPGNVRSIRLGLQNSHAWRDGQLLLRFEIRCELYDAESEPSPEGTPDDSRLADMLCQIVCEYSHVHPDSASGATALSTEQVEAFSDSVAIVDAFPYIREAIGSMSMRLGFPRVLLGTYRPGRALTFTTAVATES